MKQSDIYYVKDPQYGDISQHGEAVEHVAETHENGGNNWLIRMGIQIFTASSSTIDSAWSRHMPQRPNFGEQKLSKFPANTSRSQGFTAQK